MRIGADSCTTGENSVLFLSLSLPFFLTLFHFSFILLLTHTNKDRGMYISKPQVFSLSEKVTPDSFTLFTADQWECVIKAFMMSCHAGGSVCVCVCVSFRLLSPEQELGRVGQSQHNKHSFANRDSDLSSATLFLSVTLSLSFSLKDPVCRI